MTDANGETWTFTWQDFHGDSLLLETESPTGLVSTRTYDAAGQLLAIEVTNGSGNTLTHHSYAYNNVGERTTRTEILPGFGTSQESFGYDNAGQVISATYQQPQPGAGVAGGSLSAATYTFDPAGNRTQIIRDAAPLAYAVNDVNQYTQVGGDAQSYNSRGDLVEHLGWTLTYDADGHLVTAVEAGASPTTLHYLYDGGGRRVGRVESDGSGGWSTEWLLQLGVQVLEARNPVTGATSHFVYEPGLDQPLCRVDGNVGTTGTVAHYFHQDALGSVVALTDTSGAVIESYRYTAWGKPSVYDGSGVLQAAGTAAQSAFLFAGREYETATGLAHHRNRTYSPVLGRWMSPDPIERVEGRLAELLNDGPNLFGYVGNRGVNAIDPHGLQPKDKWWQFEGKKHRDFRRWVHEVKQDEGRRHDYDRGELEELYEEYEKESDSEEEDGMSDCEKVAVGITVGYLIYRGIRLAPSLYPPLWPTLGPNLATP